MFNKSKKPENISTNSLYENVDIKQEFKNQVINENIKKLAEQNNVSELLISKTKQNNKTLEKQINKINGNIVVNDSQINKDSFSNSEKLCKLYSEWIKEFYMKNIKDKKFKEEIEISKESENIRIIKVRKNKINNNL